MGQESRLLMLVAFAVAAMLIAPGCDSGTGDPQGDSGFNGNFGGSVTIMRNGQPTADTILMSLQVHSPLTGDFIMVNGTTGSLVGEVDGTSGTFTATVLLPCSGSFSGTIDLIGGNSISLNASGSDCDGPFDISAAINRISLIDLVGEWAATRIEGAAPPYDYPQDGSVSTWTFYSNGTYAWFLHASPYYYLDGVGTYSINGNILTVDGIVADALYSMSPGSEVSIPLTILGPNSFRFPDEDQDRWTYERQ